MIKTISKITRKQIISNAKAEGVDCGAWFYRCNGRRPIRSSTPIIPGKMSYDELTIEHNANDAFQTFLDDNSISDDDERFAIMEVYCDAYLKAALNWRPI
jgi:hypothetical protein